VISFNADETILLEEVIEDDLEFSRKGTRFKCKLCTKCCSLERIFITIYDLKKIYKAAPEYIFKIVSFFSDHYDREVLTPIKNPKKRMKCSFLEDNKCILHGIAKPLCCQRYPFTFILEETVKERGLIPPEDALKETIYFMGTEISGYIMHPKTCPGVNNDEGEKIDGKEIAKSTIKNSLEHLETKNQDLIGILKKLQHETKRRLEFLDNFVKTATLKKLEIPLPGSSAFIGGFIAFNKEVLGENYLDLISSITTLLNQELSTENTKALATILSIVKAEKEGAQFKLKKFKTLIFGIFQSKKKDEKQEVKSLIPDQITVEQVIDLVNKTGISEEFRKEKSIKFLKQIIPIDY